jgi:hypothetical protein
MKDKIKYYSKDTFKQEKNIETTIVLICVFLIGFIAGYICMNRISRKGVDSSLVR